ADRHNRRPRYDRQAASAAARLHRGAGGAMRLLHQRHDHGRERDPRSDSAAERAGGARGTCRQSVPLRHARPHHPRGAARRARWRQDVSALTRRQFGQAAGALVLSFTLSPRLGRAAAAKLPGSLEKNRMLDAWLRINADGSATIFAGKVELGQGILTALAQIAAEELDLPLARVAMISGDTAQPPDEESPSGSQSIEYGGTAVRLACAEALALLLARAAARLDTPAERLTVADGTIRAPDGRSIGYGELAAELDLHRDVTAKVEPKPTPSHKIVGTSTLRRDIPAKVTGGVAYVQDLRLPGMVHGRVVRPPRHGAKLVAVDAAQAGAMPGVITVVRDGTF